MRWAGDLSGGVLLQSGVYVPGTGTEIEPEYDRARLLARPIFVQREQEADADASASRLVSFRCMKRQSVLAQAGGDDGHGVDLLGVAAAGEVVDGGVQALQDGAVGVKGAQALGDLVADVAGVDVREDEGVGVAGHLGVGALGVGHTGRHGGVELQLAVHGQVGRQRP